MRKGCAFCLGLVSYAQKSAPNDLRTGCELDWITFVSGAEDLCNEDAFFELQMALEEDWDLH